jgi:hypothetical protein
VLPVLYSPSDQRDREQHIRSKSTPVKYLLDPDLLVTKMNQLSLLSFKS